ncbi:uncharacterized protein B0H64DRAFT_440877 [Chaetomium fimeti]|uniref:Uncharacterized protein n=1 Tax=Chaetomium fimeti TaxID=1854472 RepID=A0AAE0LUK5_9PEZI|nr:hypothetical protein B0H64DRAFT_440877 [Chaetomium fimeti]
MAPDNSIAPSNYSELLKCVEIDDRESPANAGDWRKEVGEFLGLSDPAAMRLSDMTRWKIGPRMASPSGSKLMYEHFLHLRAFVQNHRPFEFDLHQFVDDQYATAASRLLEKGAWEDFDHYRRSVGNSDPDIRILGQFASAKVDQNHVLIDAYGGNGLGHDGEEKQFVGGTHEDSEETPSRRASTRFLPMKPDYRSPPGDCDAADEAIVNKAMAGFASILTRPFTKEFARAPDSPSRTQVELEPTYDQVRTGLARWTIERNRFHIKERRRENDTRQARAVTDAKCKPGQHFKILETQTDGHLYSLYETLALMEVKRRTRYKSAVGWKTIEWQETAEIFAWQNNCLRTEQEQGKMDVSRRFLKPPTESNRKRCLLVSQDREECFIIIGEFDAYWEYYCVEGLLPNITSGPSALSTKLGDLYLGNEVLKGAEHSKGTERLKRDGGGGAERLQGDETLKHYGLDGCPVPGPDDGFLAVHVYGPFLTTNQDHMVALSANLLGMTMHLAGVTRETLGYFEQKARSSVKEYKAGRTSSGSSGSGTSQGSEDSLWVQRSTLFS